MNDFLKIGDYAEGIAKLVFAPDYYQGEWIVFWRGHKKTVKNYETSCAWAKYIRRNYKDGWTATVGKKVCNA